MSVFFSSTPVLIPKKFRELIGPLEKMQRDVVGGVEEKADGAQIAADNAQSDATLSLAQVQALAEANAAAVKRSNFLRHWYAGG